MMHKRGAFSRQPSYEASKIEKPSDKRTTRNWAQRAAAVLELATGALWSTRAWYCTAGGLPLPMYRCVPILCMYIVVAFFPVPSAFSFGFRCGNVLESTPGFHFALGSKTAENTPDFLYHFFLSYGHFLETIIYLCDQLR